MIHGYLTLNIAFDHSSCIVVPYSPERFESFDMNIGPEALGH
jgi:hypothetical protein